MYTTRRSLKSILVVEDDSDIRDLLEMTLTEIGGYQVSKAHNGLMALEILKEGQIDLILMDVKMPYLDGPSTFINMKSCSKLCKIPVVFVTGATLNRELESLLDLGGVAYILKPFDPLTLCDKINTIWKAKEPNETITSY